MIEKDWTGNKNSIFKTLGASNHTEKDRQNEDYYATDPIAAELLLEVEQFSENIWECSSGENHLANVFKEKELARKLLASFIMLLGAIIIIINKF
jgi:hypothetical protein